jgi:molecular chaperone GrpE (heat shock protein)
MKTKTSKPVKGAIKSVVKTKPVKLTFKTARKAAVQSTATKTGKPVIQSKAALATPVAATVASVESLRQEITALRTHLAKVLSPVASGTIEEVDALRRVLGDLMETRMNEVIRELVGIRNTAAAVGPEARRVSEQIEALLTDLGAMKFEADRLEYVDPLIHTVIREVSDASLPDGVIVETIRPGFHTGRGLVVAKALVAMNRRI